MTEWSRGRRWGVRVRAVARPRVAQVGGGGLVGAIVVVVVFTSN